jgi:hypothetical protein
VSALAFTTAAAAFVLGLRPPAPPPVLVPVAHDVTAAGEAIAAWLADATGVVAFGEVHQDAATVGTRSALARFTDDVLPALAPRASHLIVETWVADGACGAAEAHVTADVARTTERPTETESEIVRLLRRAKESGVAPHVLSVSCGEYASLSQNAGRVDYDRLLKLTERHLERAVRQAVMLPRAPGRPLVLVYGGALHNDLYPRRALAAYAFGPAIYALTRGDYREVDLYVPELVGKLAAMRAEPWFAAWRAHARPAATVMIPRSARSTIVVLPAGVPAQR